MPQTNRTLIQDYDKKRPKAFVQGLLFPWLICIIAAFFYSYDFILRISPSIMISPLMHDLSINAAGIGLLSAFYFYAYTPLQIPAGVAVDKYNRHRVLTFAALLCVGGTFIFASAHNLYLMFLARILMGAGSAFAFVGALKLASLWLPHKTFAFYTGFATALGTLGAIFADTVLSHFVVHFGWRNTAYLIGCVGIVLLLLVFIFIRNRPPWIPKLPDEFHNWRNVLIRFLIILKYWRFWINGIVGALLFMPVSVFASLWGVSFIEHSFYFSATQATTVTSLIFLGVVFGGPAAGWFSDFINSRKIPLFSASIIITVLAAIVIYISNIPHWLVYILLFVIGLATGAQVLVFAIAREVCPPGTTGLASS